MLHEHALTYKDQLSVRELDYIIKKANKLGKLGKEIINVYEQSDSEGIHIYFSVMGLAGEQRRDEREV
jgi:hypothetical protein